MRSRTLFSAALAAGLVFRASTALACGGTFCDGGGGVQAPVPVNQTGENVIFAYTGATVEAHVQVQYTAGAHRFAWIVPLSQLPVGDIQVGSEALFDNLLVSSVPTFQAIPAFDICTNGVHSAGSGCGATDASEDDATAGTGPVYDKHGTGDDASTGNPVVKTETVGAFEIAILKGQSTAEVTDWLTTNDYALPTGASALIAQYVTQGYYFAAIKLSAGETATAIHPLVFQYNQAAPCVPLRLTSVAAENDMGVRVFFLGNTRVVPTGDYLGVDIDEARFNWLAPGTDYAQVVSAAVDSPGANGHGFVTDYAGPSSIIATTGIYSSTWDPTAFAHLPVRQVVATMTTQGLLSCGAGVCTSFHPLALPLLQELLPVPSTYTEYDYYSNLATIPATDLPADWDGQKLADGLKQRIVDPAEHALALLAQSTYLTRLYTTISPSEMTVDPEFAPRNGMPDVPFAHTATLRTTCNGATGVTLGDGRTLALTTGPATNAPGLPTTYAAARTLTQYGADGSSVVIATNAPASDQALASYNESQNWPPKADLGASPSSCTAVRRGRAPYGIFFGLIGLTGLLRRVLRRRDR